MQCDVDQLAEHLHLFGRRAQALPASFVSDGITIPVVDHHGRKLGDLLPGVGMRLDVDLKEVGILRPVPGVLGRSVYARCAERILRAGERLLHDERGAITSFDQIIAARLGGNGEDFLFQKDTITTTSLAWYSMFRSSGMPTAGSYSAIPGGAAPNAASAGSLSQSLTAPGSDTKVLLSIGLVSSALLNATMFTDLLVVAGSISATTNSPQTINTTALTRYTTGAGVCAILEVTTALGGTASNLTIGYTNSAGTNSRTSVSAAMITSAIVQRLQPSNMMPSIMLQAGDTGVRSVETLTLSASMAGAGVLGLMLHRPLVLMTGTAAGIYIERDLASQIDGLVKLETEAGGTLGCVVMFVFPNSTASGAVGGRIATCTG